MMDQRRGKLAKLLKQTYSFFQKELDEFAIQVWENSLAEYSYDRIASAFLVAISESEFLPMPARILKELKRSCAPEASLNPLPAPIKKDGCVTFSEWRSKNNLNLSSAGESWAKCLAYKGPLKREAPADGGRKMFDEMLEASMEKENVC